MDDVNIPFLGRRASFCAACLAGALDLWEALRAQRYDGMDLPRGSGERCSSVRGSHFSYDSTRRVRSLHVPVVPLHNKDVPGLCRGGCWAGGGRPVVGGSSRLGT